MKRMKKSAGGVQFHFVEIMGGAFSCKGSTLALIRSLLLFIWKCHIDEEYNDMGDIITMDIGS